MPRFGPLEIILVLVIILIIFGVGKLPQVGSAMGRGIREFRKAKDGIVEDTKVTTDITSEDPEGKKTS